MAELALVGPGIEAPIEDSAAAEAEDGARRKSRRRRLIGGIGALLALVGGWAGYEYQTVWQYLESTDNAYVRADITPVAAKVEGYVARLAVADGQRVRAGDVLMVLESADYEARVARAEAELAAARANVGTLAARRGSAEATVAAQGGSIAQAEARLAAARAQAARAAADERRLSALASDGWTTRARLDEVRAASAAAAAEVEAARAAIAGARSQAGALRSDSVGASAGIAGGEAQVRAAEAALRTARLDLERTIIRAPIDGVVGNRAVRAGQLVRPGQALLSIVPVEAAYVVANFKETQLADMRVGQPVEVAVDAYGGRTFRGTIESLSPASGAQFALIPSDTATGNFTRIVQRVPVRIRLAPEPGAPPLRAGLSVEATVDTSG
jgi:membrane fusion protein (multidrug efflux system)